MSDTCSLYSMAEQIVYNASAYTMTVTTTNVFLITSHHCEEPLRSETS